MLISNKVLNQIQTQFDWYYFNHYQNIRKEQPTLFFSLEHQSRKMIARFGHHETGILLDDESLVSSITEMLKQIQIFHLQVLFSKNTKIKFDRMFEDGNFEFSFSNSNHQGVMIANSEELYILLNSDRKDVSKIMYQISKDDNIWDFLEYYFDGKEFFPIGRKRANANTLSEAVNMVKNRPFQEVVPNELIIKKILHLYHTPGLKEYLEEPVIHNKKEYYLTQR